MNAKCYCFLFTDPQAAIPGGFCPKCGSECYAPGFFCLRCEVRNL